MKWWKRWKSRKARAEKQRIHDETVQRVVANFKEVEGRHRRCNPSFIVRWYPEIHPKYRGKHVR